MTRKGISFTLTLVVIGVVLLMTALTVIVLGGGEIGQTIENLGDTRSDTEVVQKCNNIAQQIQRNYCSNWAAFTEDGSESNGISGGRLSGCRIVKSTRSPSFARKATEMNCDWYSGVNHGSSGEETTIRRVVTQGSDTGAESILQDTLTHVDESGSWEPVVRQADGSLYNCLDQGHIDRTCPTN